MSQLSAGDILEFAAANSGIPGGAVIGSMLGSALDTLGSNPEGGNEPGANVVWNMRATNPPSPEWKIALFLQWLREYSPATLGPTSPGLWDRTHKGSASNWNDAYYSTKAANFVAPDGTKPWVPGKFTLDGNYNPIPIPGATYSANEIEAQQTQSQQILNPRGKFLTTIFSWLPDEWTDETKKKALIGTAAVVVALIGLLIWKPWRKKYIRRKRRSSI